jgi:ribosome-associated heat shock protein Hsp15
VRLDVLLHELRLFKSRSQAAAAVERGEVRVGGRVTKASHTVRVGERLTLVGSRGSRTLEVLELPTRSLRKEEAKRLVRDVPSEEAGSDER